jgi:hypothetical protein
MWGGGFFRSAAPHFFVRIFSVISDRKFQAAMFNIGEFSNPRDVVFQKYSRKSPTKENTKISIAVLPADRSKPESARGPSVEVPKPSELRQCLETASRESNPQNAPRGSKVPKGRQKNSPPF